MRSLILLSVLSLAACLGLPPVNDCEVDGMFVRSEQEIDCDKVQPEIRLSIAALGVFTHSYERDGKTWGGNYSIEMVTHALRMYVIKIGYPYAPGWSHSLPYETQCDGATIWIEEPSAFSLTHEFAHVADNCNGYRVTTDGYLSIFGKPIPKGGIDWHYAWDLDGRRDATLVAAAYESAAAHSETVAP